LVALKCDLREALEDEEENVNEPRRPMVEYKQGLQVAQNIKAMRYLGKFLRFVISDQSLIQNAECSAMKNRGVKEAFVETAKVALSVKNPSDKRGGVCSIM
jgi:Rho family, other